MKQSIPVDLAGKELFEFLLKNKNLLITEKKSTVKFGDAFCLSNLYINEKGEVEDISKAANSGIDENVDAIQVLSIINTCNWMDSHSDVHIPGIWKKSLSENKMLYLLQEHSMTFKGIITDDLKASTRDYSWKDLGVDAPGVTEALVFDSRIEKSRNTFMFNEYRMKRVKNHSVGMNYVRIEMAINDDEYKSEFAVWNKYIGQIANKSLAEKKGYFFAVTEAKVVEGSAVPIGSNRITPTQSVEQAKSMDQPLEGTETQPVTTTEKKPFDALKAIQSTTFLKN